MHVHCAFMCIALVIYRGVFKEMHTFNFTYVFSIDFNFFYLIHTYNKISAILIDCSIV